MQYFLLFLLLSPFEMLLYELFLRENHILVYQCEKRKGETFLFSYYVVKVREYMKLSHAYEGKYQVKNWPTSPKQQLRPKFIVGE